MDLGKGALAGGIVGQKPRGPRVDERRPPCPPRCQIKLEAPEPLLTSASSVECRRIGRPSPASSREWRHDSPQAGRCRAREGSDAPRPCRNPGTGSAVRRLAAAPASSPRYAPQNTRHRWRSERCRPRGRPMIWTGIPILLSAAGRNAGPSAGARAKTARTLESRCGSRSCWSEAAISGSLLPASSSRLK